MKAGNKVNSILGKVKKTYERCVADNTEENTSYRKDAWNYFGGEEKFADALVLYFGGSYNHYRLTGDLTNEENIYLTKFIDTCSES